MCESQTGEKQSPVISPHAETFYSVPDSSQKNRSSEQGPLGQILESERYSRERHSVLIDSLVETLKHDRLSGTFVGLGRHIGFLQDITLDWTLLLFFTSTPATVNFIV